MTPLKVPAKTVPVPKPIVRSRTNYVAAGPPSVATIVLPAQTVATLGRVSEMSKVAALVAMCVVVTS